MSSADLYTIILGTVIIVHRLPAVFSPRLFRRMYDAFALRESTVRLTGLFLLMLSGWGIYAHLVNYRKPGWFIIGLSVFILFKSLGYLLFPKGTTDADRRANAMSDFALSIISLGMVIAGALVLVTAVRLN